MSRRGERWHVRVAHSTDGAGRRRWRCFTVASEDEAHEIAEHWDPRHRRGPRRGSDGGPRFAVAELLAGLTDRQAALQLGVAPTTVARARVAGLDEISADEWAVALGRHPAEIWPTW